MLRTGGIGTGSEESAAHLGASVGGGAAGGEVHALSRVVEGEIIPRLLIAHSLTGESLTAGMEELLAGVHRLDRATGGPGASEIDRLASDAIDQDAWSLLQHVEALLSLGHSVEGLLVDLLAPAARRLGEWWEQDLCDFVDVTMGLWRLQEVMHELAAGVPGAGGVTAGARAALFAVPPGETHVFGSVMVETCFRRAGWRTRSATESSLAEIERDLARGWFDLVGLTVSNADSVEELGDLIARLRLVSANPDLAVLVGGTVFSAKPDLADHVGADGTAADARQAVVLAERLCRVRMRAKSMGLSSAAGAG
jgi:methanogenic corrinoid protein MtbC1